MNNLGCKTKREGRAVGPEGNRIWTKGAIAVIFVFRTKCRENEDERREREFTEGRSGQSAGDGCGGKGQRARQPTSQPACVSHPWHVQNIALRKTQGKRK